jgi:gluconolactonase
MKNIKVIDKFILLLFLLIISGGCSSINKITEPKLFASGFKFTEGPALDKDGNLYVVNFKGTLINKITPDGVVSVACDVGYFNNGSIFDKDGNLFIACSGKPSILKLDKKGILTLVTATSGNDSLLGPNDLTWDDKGRLYFTDPKGSSPKNLIGGVHFIDTDGKTKKFAGGMSYPNGIVFDKKRNCLYVDEYSAETISRSSLNPDGTADKKELFFTFPNGSGPDGMKLDEKGNIWVAINSKSEIWGITPQGKLIKQIKIPAKGVTNLIFFGKDRRKAYVTAVNDLKTYDGSIYIITMPYAGLKNTP